MAIAPPGAAQSRLRPPDFVVCDRNLLTVHRGRAVALVREPSRTILRMRTDENTDEVFTLSHPGGDAAPWFLIAGKPFGPGDWKTLLPGGRLSRDARATVWACAGALNPKVDWEAPGEKPTVK